MSGVERGGSNGHGDEQVKVTESGLSGQMTVERQKCQFTHVVDKLIIACIQIHEKNDVFKGAAQLQSITILGR
jgi:hypothetical protein